MGCSNECVHIVRKKRFLGVNERSHCWEWVCESLFYVKDMCINHAADELQYIGLDPIAAIFNLS
jgi:hypothetical protein